MIQEIINGMINAIRIDYDNDYQIYTEPIEQGLKEPCFSILPLRSTNTDKLADRKERSYPFNITYFPLSVDEPRNECLQVMETLFYSLSIINVGHSFLRAKEMDGIVDDGLLQFQVTYTISIIENEEEEKMLKQYSVINGKE